MALSCGLLGLPNVGKSTLFNVLVGAQRAAAENRPFCTIDPNKGSVLVPDARLKVLAQVSGSKKTVSSTFDVTDIAGLVKGASTGAGLGNSFLGHVREVSALVHVVRCFDRPDVTHVAGVVDPTSDVAVIQTELMLADLDSVSRRLPTLEKNLKHIKNPADPLDPLRLDLMRRFKTVLEEGHMLSDFIEQSGLSEEENTAARGLNLLTTKPVLYVLNVDEKTGMKALKDKEEPENQYTQAFKKAFPRASCVVLAVALEEMRMSLSEEDKEVLLGEAAHSQPGLVALAQGAFRLLNQEVFLTTGPEETRAWAFRKGIKAPEAAGLIHSDLQRGFIMADVCDYETFVALGGEQQARLAGKIRKEGKEYLVQDGDIMHIKFNV